MSLSTPSLPSLLRRLEEGRLAHPPVHMHGHLSLIPRMRRTASLHGHHGCVNRLALSADATQLLSASDDCSLRIWDVASLRPRATVLPGHILNVFGVAFMPHTADRYVVSAGLDHEVRHTHVEGREARLWTCHKCTVKTVSPVSRDVFVTASKDGTARQMDVRMPSHYSQVVVRILGWNRRPRPLSSAEVSPLSENHLLVAASEPYVRIFDRRRGGDVVETEREFGESGMAGGPSSNCLEKLCAPHMHESAPEFGLHTLHRRRTCATFATWAPDAGQVVASFYGDKVHVFDVGARGPSVACRTPFRTRLQQRLQAFACLQAALAAWHRGRFNEAIGKANAVLEGGEGAEVLALVVKAAALGGRRSFGDARSAHATLERVIGVVNGEEGKIAELWGEQYGGGPLCMTWGGERCREMQDVWVHVFQYMQVAALMLMTLDPTHHRRNGCRDVQGDSLTKRRLEHLKELISNLDQFRKTQLSCLTQSAAYEKALGTEAESEVLYSTSASRLRREFLEKLFRKFNDGVPMLKAKIRSRMACYGVAQDMGRRMQMLQRATSTDSECESQSDSAQEAASMPDSDSDDETSSMDEKPPFAEIPHPMLNRGGELQDAAKYLWGPLPAAQANWRSFHGHTSTETDIKEARFLGAKSQVVMSGSDDGLVYMWAARTGELLARVPGDKQIVNCVLPHPTRSTIFVSGIDWTIKVLTPGTDEDPEKDLAPEDIQNRKLFGS